MKWIKVEDKLPEDGQDVMVLIYENWDRDRNGKLISNFLINHRKEDEGWNVCGGTYSKYEWYIQCKPGIEGGFGNIYNDYDEGQLIYVVAWCPTPEIEELR